MAYSIEYDPRAVKDLQSLDRPMQLQILDYMDSRVAKAHDPRIFGKALRHGKFCGATVWAITVLFASCRTSDSPSWSWLSDIAARSTGASSRTPK